MDSPAVLSTRKVPEDHTSGSRTNAPAASFPDRMTTSPFASVVLVGYHRPRRMGTARLQLRVVGLKMVLSGMPLRATLGSLFPPDISSRPSGRNEWPAQKITAGLGIA